MMRVRRGAAQVTRSILVLVAFVLVAAEGAIWAACSAAGAQLARIPLWRTLEHLVERLDARLVLGLFLLPMVALLPVKLGALWLLAHGHPLGGLALLVAGKVAGTAFSARLYAVAEPKLMSLALFARGRNLAFALHARALAYLGQSPAWQSARRAVSIARASAARLLAATRALAAPGGGGIAARFAAARRLARRGR